MKQMLEDYGKPGGAGDPTKKIEDIVDKKLDDFSDSGGGSTKGIQAVLDGYGITSLGIFQ